MNLLTLETVAGGLLTRMADASLRAIALAALAGMLIACLRKRPAAQHVVWTVVVAGMTLLPVLRPMIPSARLPLSQPLMLQAVSVEPEPQLSTTSSNTVMATAGKSQEPLFRPSWRMVAALACLGGMLLFTARLLAGFLLAGRLLHRARSVGEELCRYHDLIVAAGTRVKIQESERVRVPVTLGLRTLRIILPPDWRTWSEEKMNIVLAHELAHVRRRDPLFALLAALNKCIFWFHPLAWWLERRLAVLAEQAADDAGMTAAPNAESYARTVLEVASSMKEQNRRLVWHGVAMDGPLLVQRIRRVMDPRTQKYMKRLGKTARVGLLTSAGMLLWVVAAVDFHDVARAQTSGSSHLGGEISLSGGKGAQSNPNCLCFFTDDRLPDPKPTTAEEAAAMERQLAANPEDDSTRLRLLRYDWKNNLESQRVPLVLWLIDHHPESPLHQYETAGLFVSYPGDHRSDATVIADAKQRWLAQVDAHPEDAQVLLNAARFLRERSIGETIDLLKRAQKLDPAQKTKALAEVYSSVLLQSASKGKSGAPANDSGLAAQIRSELQASNDVALVGAVAHRVVQDSVWHSEIDSSRWDLAALKTIANELVTHAQALEPQSQEWSDLMQGVNGLQAGPQPRPSAGNPSIPVSPESMHVSDQVAAGALINAPLPVYPPLAKIARVEGMVILQARIGTDGRVTELKVTSGHPMLVQAALDAVRGYIYKPFLLNGNPATVQTTVKIPFSLGEAGPDAKMETLNATNQASRINPPADLPQTVRVGKAVAAGNLIEAPKPVYPPLAKAARILGVVVLSVRIGSDGHVVDAKLISGHPMLAQAAMDAVKQYVYKPYLLNGSPVDVVTIVDVPFAEDQS
jgi:TonB family protein